MVDSDPYVGLRAFAVEDGDRFYGRGHESHDLLSAWCANRLLIVHGPAGSGKTSLLRAGVLPRLRAEAGYVLPVGRLTRRFSFPTAALPEHNPYELALMQSWSPADSPARLAGLRLDDFLYRLIAANSADQSGPIMLAIDQLEELFESVGPGQQAMRERFIDNLVRTVRTVPQIRLLISIRDVALGELSTLEAGFADHATTRIPVSALTPEAALEAIVRPLAATTRMFAPGVAETLVADLLGSGVVEPAHLQVVCTDLWRSLPETARVIADQQASHDIVNRALANFCVRMVTSVATDYLLPRRRLMRWLKKSFLPDSARPVLEGPDETAKMPNPVVHALEDHHILKSWMSSGVRRYGLRHDRLVEPIRRASRRDQPELERDRSASDLLQSAEVVLARGAVEVAERHAAEARLMGAGDLRTCADTESFLGNIAFDRGHLDAAERHHRAAAEYFEMLQDPVAAGQQLVAVGCLLQTRGNYSAALDVLFAAVSRLRGVLTAQVELARALRSSGQLEAAAAILSTVLAIVPDDATALADRGQIRSDRNDPISALEDLDNVLRLRPDIGRRADVRAARALALARLDRGSEAQVEAEAALADEPESGPVLLRVSAVARVTGEQTRADALLRRARDARKPQLLPYQLRQVRRLLAESPATNDA